MSEFVLTRRAMFLGSAAAIGILGTGKGLAGNVGAATAIVETTNGPVRGRFEAGLVQAFKGLRYAAPPVGSLRFKAPQPLTPWSEVADAAHFGNAAMQSPNQPDAPFDEKRSEDCLFLNVWTQSVTGKKPVMVWLHGGAFSSGAAGRPTYWGDHFARSGVVLVSLNHRLNAFGFTQLPESWGPDYASSGVAGMLDIIEALKWVKANIAQFGGDPDNVTIFGESGGGAKVSLLLGMPPAHGLYHKAIIQSGAALDAVPRDYALALGGALIDTLGIKAGDTAALAALGAERIFASQDAAIEKVKRFAKPGFLRDGFAPSIDGRILPHGPFTPAAPEMSNDIPLILGTNKDEGTMFAPGRGPASDADLEAYVQATYPAKVKEIVAALREANPGYGARDLITAMAGSQMFWIDSIALAERKAKQAAPVWMYRMDRELPTMGGVLKAGHATELSYVFGTYDNIRDFVGPGDEPARMSRQMHSAWVAFAKTGKPQSPEIPVWPTYDLSHRRTMIFNLESRVESDPNGALRRLMRPSA